MTSVAISHDGYQMTAELHGEVDMGSTDHIAAAVDLELRVFAPTRLTFDLGNVAFINSANWPSWWNAATGRPGPVWT